MRYQIEHMSPTLLQFVGRVEECLRIGMTGTTLTEAIELVMQEAMHDPDLLPAVCQEPQRDTTHAQYLIYASPDHAFTVTSVVWSPGAASQVHDHGIWAVLGLYQGAGRETRYTRRSEDMYGPVSPGPAMVLTPGRVSSLHPPMDDVHHFENIDSGVTITFHADGGDLSTHVHHQYNADGSVEDVTSQYAN